MITLDKIRTEIEQIEENGCMTTANIKDLAMLYYLEGKMETGKNAERQAKHMDLATAKKWVRGMKNVDGSAGEHWSYEQVSQVLRQKGFPCDCPEFYAVMNMLWSDYSKVAEKFGVNNVDFWSAMAHAFLMDEDAGEGKTMAYYECVAGH